MTNHPLASPHPEPSTSAAEAAEGAPTFDPRRSILILPPTAEAWDLELGPERDARVISVSPGAYRVTGPPPARARRLREAEWNDLDHVDAATSATEPDALPEPVPCGQPICVRPSTPDAQYLEGEEILLLLLPARDGFHEVNIQLQGASGSATRSVRQSGTWHLKRGLEIGEYTIRTRWRPPPAPEGPRAVSWTAWSRPLRLTVHPRKHSEQVNILRVAEQRLSAMVDVDLSGVPMITDPWAEPPACPEGEPIRWFRTPCFEGAGMLANEEPDYYRDPLVYYLGCIRSLLDRGFVFRTWHDLLDDPAPRGEREVILQLDVDAGPRSMVRITRHLRQMGVRGSIMVHRRCRDWYEYAIEDLDLPLLREVQAEGWTIGYHNNALSNVQGSDGAGEYGEVTLALAAEAFRGDVADLRRLFDIRVFTHHGGNALNKLTPVPPDAGITCVDRRWNPALWATIDHSFSDGGFLSRPRPLRRRLAEFDSGRFFIRNHPVKYANYVPDFDVPPLVGEDIRRVGGRVTPELETAVERGLARQRSWLGQRQIHRLGTRITHDSAVKPISTAFRPRDAIRPLVERHYATRRQTYVRQSPWMWGDPRVFWWRMLDAWAPRQGRMLNVGALPPGRREETTEYVGPDARIVEMDIDPARHPDLLCDITNPPAELDGSFDAVLLFGLLTVIPNPSEAVEACHRLTRPGGIGLFGFAADTHPTRGGLWHPDTRPLWRRGLEPLRQLGWRGCSWSFDPECVRELFGPWRQPMVESFGHMLYVVARREQ